MNQSIRTRTAFVLSISLFWCLRTMAAAPAADTVYHNGYIYTVDEKNSVRQALAIREGKIVYVGTNAGVKSYIAKETKVIDLHGRMMMPGLVDGHMHPLEGGLQLLSCSLNYEALTVTQFQERIQNCLDQSKDKEPDTWLVVQNWFQQNMLPSGVEVSHETLDQLKTKRPVIVRSSFGHSTLANTRALEVAQITSSTADPVAGKIWHDSNGNPTGLLEDAAQRLVDQLVPKPTDQENLVAALAALDAIRKQGVTTFLDASADISSIKAFSKLQQDGKLTARAHFAPVIDPADGTNADKAVAWVQELAKKYDQGPIIAKPTVTLRNVKLFMDGVITAPAFTGVMLQPYWSNQGTAKQPRWRPGNNKGPAVYFPPEVLNPLLMKLAKAGFDSHIHADGDGAVRSALDGFEEMRREFSGKQIRSAIAHAEIVDPADFARFGKLDVIPVLSFQWAKPASDTIDGAKEYLGPSRFRYLEPEGFLHKKGARIAYGSDWPVDPLNEWFALKVGVTRTNAPDAPRKYAGRLSQDPGLTRQTVVRAITMNSSYELHQEEQTGSIEVGKLADLIILDRNLFKISAEEISKIKVLLTIIGGEVVFQSDSFK